MTAENDQKKLQSLMLQIRSYQTGLQEVARQTALTEQAIAELNAAISAVEDLPDKGTEAFIPLGAGVYVKGELTDTKNLMVAVSSDVTTMKTSAESKAYLEKKKKQLEDNDKMLKQQAEKMNAELEQANQAAEELYAKLQK